MKSFAKISLLFALIIAGRFVQPTATASLATRPAAVSPAFTHYVAPIESTVISQHSASKPSRGYFL